MARVLAVPEGEIVELRGMAELLERSVAAQRRLTQLALEDAGWPAVVELLGELIEREVVFEPDPSGSEAALAWPISIAGEDLGTVSVLGEPPDPIDLPVLEHGLSVLAGELLRERTARDVEWRVAGEVLDAVLAQGGTVDRRLAQRAARLGIDLGAPHHAIAIESYDTELCERRLRLALGTLAPEVRTPTLLTRLTPQRILVLCAARGDDSVDALVDAALGAAGQDGTLAVGVSRAGTDLSRSLRECLACVRFAHLSGDARRCVRADRLGPLGFLFALENSEPACEYVQEQLGPLLTTGPGEREQELLRTLRAFLETDGQLQEVASRCFIHKSTVKYRMAQIAEILGRRLSEPSTRFELRLAFAVSDALEGLAQPTPLRVAAAA